MTCRFSFALLGLTSMLAATPRGLRAQDMGIAIGTKAPAAADETLDGKPSDLAQYVGKTGVLIEFWATWCRNCRELEPPLKAMHAKYANHVKFVGMPVSSNHFRDRMTPH